MRQAGGHPAPAGGICHRAELITERKQLLRQPLLSLGRLLPQLVLSLLQETPALTPGLRRHVRRLLPGNLGYVFSCLNAAVTQVRRLILDHVSRALLLRQPGRQRLAALRWRRSGQVVICHLVISSM
jgi:hypothetical protein